MDGDRIVARDVDRAAQAVKAEALGKFVGHRRLAIDQHVAFAGGAVAPDEEIEHRLALRGQQRGIDRAFGKPCGVYVIGEEALEKGGNIFGPVARGKADDGTVGKTGGSHLGLP